MIGINPAAASYTPGMKFLTAVTVSDRTGLFGELQLRVDLLHEVEKVDGAILMTLDHQGGRHEGRLRWNMPPEMGKDPEGRHRTVVWADAMPDAGFDAIRMFADAMLRKRGYGELPILALVVSEEEGSATAKVVCQIVDPGEDQLGPERQGLRVGNAVIDDQQLDIRRIVKQVAGPWYVAENVPEMSALRKGDLVMIGESGFRMEDRLVAAASEVILLEKGMDEAGVGRWMPEMLRVGGSRRLPIATLDHMDRIRERAVEASRPDEIIVAAASGPGDREEAKVELARSGTALFDVHDIADDLDRLVLGDGIWIGERIHWVDAGEDGAEWQAQWRPALQADLDRHGVSRSDAEDALSEHVAEWSLQA
jgi:hypothetical protein